MTLNELANRIFSAKCDKLSHECDFLKALGLNADVDTDCCPERVENSFADCYWRCC